MDDFGDRFKLLDKLESYLEYNKSNSKKDSAQLSFFDTAIISNEDVEQKVEKVEQDPTRLAERLVFEKELLGFYLTGHPLDKYRKILDTRDITIAWIHKEGVEEKEYVIGGLVYDIREIPTKKDPAKKIMFFKIKDLTSEIEVVVFPKEIEKAKRVIKNESCFVLKGKVSIREDKKSLIFTEAKLLL